MARNGGKRGRGLRRPPPGPPREPSPERTQTQSSGGSVRGTGRTKRQAKAQTRRGEDPPEDELRLSPSPPREAAVHSVGLGDRNNGFKGTGNPRRNKITRPLPPSSTTPTRSFTKKSMNRQGYPHMDVHGDDCDDLFASEEERYSDFYGEEYYDQRYHNHPQSRSLQHQKLQHYSSHRQFNLKPLYDVEMSSLNNKKGKDQSRNNARWKGRTKYSQVHDQSRSRREDGNPLEHNGRILAYLDSDTENSTGTGSGGDSLNQQEDGAKLHTEFYDYDVESYDDDYDEEDDDEERPLRKSRSSNRLQRNEFRGQSIMGRSEQCLNRSLVLSFAIVCFVFARNRTPWWKEHERRVAFQKHHHHHTLDGTDDDDLRANIDPMTIYNSNDDDSTHTRDHDPLNIYEKYTNRDKEEHILNAPSEGKRAEPTLGQPVGETRSNDHELRAAVKPDNLVVEKHDEQLDPSDKYGMVTAGERISNRPGMKSLHHGFRDETYSNRPAAKNSGSMVKTYGNRVPSDAASHFDVGKEVGAGSVSEANLQAVHSVDVSSKQMSPSEAARSGIMNGGLTASSMGHTDLNVEVTPTMFQHPVSENEHPPPPNIDRPYNIPQPPGSSDNASTSDNEEHRGGISNKNEARSSVVDGRSSANVGPTDPQRPQLNPQNQELVTNEKYDDSMGTLIEWGEQETSEKGDDLGRKTVDPNNGNDRDIAQSFSPPLSQSMQPFDQNQPILNQAASGEEIATIFEESYYRWNHPLRPINPSDKGKDVPVFWRIPRSASATVESVMSFCYRIVLASSMGIAAGHDQDKTLGVITVRTGAQYVNVDMSRPGGIQRAIGMNLGSSGMVDAISTPFLFETAEVFKGIPNETGKCFSLLRHPVDRAISMYHNYQIDQSANPNTAKYRGMNIDEFADAVEENNWMVRTLDTSSLFLPSSSA
ncbi:hypothetical protein ACHAWF_008700 [Thalassiosira exigua]